MEICLSKYIKRTIQYLVELGISAGTISDYQCSAFRPIGRRLKDQECITKNPSGTGKILSQTVSEAQNIQVHLLPDQVVPCGHGFDWLI